MSAYIKYNRTLLTLPKLVKENCRFYLLIEAEINLVKLIIPQVKYTATKRLPTPNMLMVPSS